MNQRQPTWFVLEICDGGYNEFRTEQEARQYFLERIEMYENEGFDPTSEVKMGVVTFSGYVPHTIPEQL